MRNPLILERVKQFENIFIAHHKSMCDVAFNLLKDKDVAKDVVQDVFLKLWKNIESVELSEHIGSYLFKATTHTALNHMRGSNRVVRIDDFHQSIEKKDAREHVGSGADPMDLEKALERAIEKLPPRCRVIYMLSRHEGLRYQQIADTLGLSVKTIENQMTIALERLRSEIVPLIKPEMILILVLFGPRMANLFF